MLKLGVASAAAAVAIAAGVGAAGGSAAGARDAARAPAHATVKAAHTKLGTVLVDATGRTLYLFEKDRARTSNCAGACVSFWPPLLTSGAPTPGAGGVKAALLGQIMRRDGTHQVTYAGHPLYRYAGDAARGQTNGEGSHTFGAGWYVVTPAGKKIDND